jgi:hypothetical protein
MADYDRRPLPPRRMSSRGGGGGGGLRRNYSSSADEEEYSYLDDEEEEYDDDYYDDEDDDYDDDRQYNRRRSSEDDRYNNSGRSNNNRYSKHHSFHDSGDFKNYHRGGGGGGGRELVEYDDRRGGRNNHHHNRSNSRNTQHRGGGGGGGQLTSILPAGTPKQAQDIIRRYTLGMPLQNPIHMALPPTTPPEGPAREIATLQVANLNPQEYAFVRRSNGQWTFAQVAVRHDSLGQLVFIVNKMGSTKSFKRHEWPGFVRRIKWTERRVQLPPKPPLLEDEIPNVNSLEVQEGGSPEQLALENGPNKPSPAVAPNATIKPPPIPVKQHQQHLPEVSTMSIKEMKIELQSHGIDFSCFMEKQEFRNAVIDARAEAVKNALIREQQLLQRQQQQAQQQQQEEEQNHQQRHNYGYDNPNEINLNSTLDADLSNLAGQTITLQPMQDDEVSELMGDYLLTEYKWQMKVLERERLKKQAGANKMASINEHGVGGGGRDNGDGQQSSAYQSFNIESGEGEKSQPHYEKQAFAKSQKWGSISEDV